MAARWIDGPAEVTLRVPPPLGRVLTVERGDDHVSLLDEDVVVAGAPGDAGGRGPRRGVVGRRGARRFALPLARQAPVPDLLRLRATAGTWRRALHLPGAGRGARDLRRSVDAGRLARRRSRQRARRVRLGSAGLPERHRHRSLRRRRPDPARTTGCRAASAVRATCRTWSRPGRSPATARKLETASAVFTADGSLCAVARAVWIEVSAES